MEQLLKNAFTQQIKAKIGANFEEFIDEMFLLKYGADDYIPIRGTKDKGNDGTILSENKILACYAPNKYSKTEFEVKVLGSTKKEGDFPKYITNWKKLYSNWEMLVNHEISPDQLTLVEGLEGSTSIKGIKQIISIIENDLNTNQMRRLAKYLGIEEFVKQDYLLDIINDLLSNTKIDGSSLKFDRKSLIDITRKIELNFEKEDVDGIKSEITLVMPDFNLIDNLLSGYDDNEKDIIKWRVIEDYNKLSGNFKIRLNNLSKQYTKQYGNIEDDGYRKYTKVLLLYMFEQCLIGKKTDKEI